MTPHHRGVAATHLARYLRSQGLPVSPPAEPSHALAVVAEFDLPTTVELRPAHLGWRVQVRVHRPFCWRAVWSTRYRRGRRARQGWLHAQLVSHLATYAEQLALRPLPAAPNRPVAAPRATVGLHHPG